jgi:type II secretory pathway component GspD/PulD (secretin)
MRSKTTRLLPLFICPFLLAAPSVFPEEKKEAQQDGFTINYNTVNIIEYIRFASKICNVNFIFNEQDLNFTVTVVSEGPITSESVMSTLVQILRIHGLMLLEQDNNLVIHKSADVKQLATLVTQPGEGKNAPIVTRIFRIRNANPSSVAAIIRPMLSAGAMLEESTETRQLILTDVTANVDKVANLIENLDSPHTLLDIQTYEAAHNAPHYLIELAGQIMQPIAQGNPFILVPAELANLVYVVSTPELSQKALTVLTALDQPPKKSVLAGRKIKSENIYVYKLQYRGGEEVIQGLENIADSLEKAGVPDQDLLDAIDNAKYIPSTQSILFVGSESTIDKMKEFLAALDVASGTVESERTSFFVYKPAHRSAKEIDASIREMARNLSGTKGSDPALIETIESAKINASTNTITFSGEDKTFARVRELLETIDTPNGRSKASFKHNFYVYKIQSAPPQEIEASLRQFAKSLDQSNASEEGLVETIEQMKYIKETNSLLFTGPDPALKRLQELVPSFDSGIAGQMMGGQFFIYKPKVQKGEQLVSSVHDLTENLKSNALADPGLLRALESMKWVQSTNSILFTGDPASIKKVEELMATLDVPSSGPLKPGSEKNFFLYAPTYASKEKTETYLKQVADHLSKRGEEDLVDTLKSAQWIEPSRSFMFHGSQNSLNRVQELLKNFDTPAQQQAPARTFALVPIKYATREAADQYLNQVTSNLVATKGDPALIEALQSKKWIAESNSFMFNGSDATLTKIREMLASFDTPEEGKKISGKQGYFIYKLQNTSGDVVEEDLDNLAKNFKSSGLKDVKILDVIDSMRYIKETNSLLLTGDPKAIEEVKDLIAKYDYARTTRGPVSSNFFMYKPQHVSASSVEKSLRDIGTNLKRADLADPALLAAIDSVKYVDTTNSLIFTGTPDAISKIQTLIKDIDVPPAKHAPIQHVGKTSFLLYKLKHASGPQITTALKAIIVDLKKSGTADKDFLAALNTMKFIKETDSLMFTGSEEALGKVQTLVEKFDVTSLAAPTPVAPAPTGPTNFFVYKPQSISGPELEKMMADFIENLKMTGLSDPDLFNTVASMRWVEKTQSLIFTGNQKSLDQIKELLKDFDIPSNLPSGPAPGGPLEPTIQAIDNTSFLVYKLQFHKGDEIQGALRQIAKDLILTNAPINQNLLNSINSIQWLEVTNSLLCSGDQETLTRLRELIKNLDIPLKQVFIEMLVIQTSLTNALTFGLEWGGNYKYRDKFAGAMNNTIPPSDSSVASSTTDPLLETLSSVLPSTSSSTNIPPPAPAGIQQVGNGFDLGIVGQVIKHNGQTYLNLSSLMSALQTDGEAAIVMTPKLITQDGRTSSIFSGQNIPFAGSFISSSSGGSNPSANVGTTNIEYRDVGVNLTITPVLGNSDIVTLDITLDQTSTASGANGQITLNQNGFPTSINGITTSKTTMQTTVHIPDNHFLILSGMVNNSNAKVKTGIPCLGGLPIVGAAFSQDNDTISNTNIVIFLRPHILNSLDDMTRITQEQEEFFRDQAATPNLLHQYNEAMELIKTVDDE